MTRGWISAAVLAGLTILGAGAARAEDAPLKLLSDQLRLQGFACEQPKDAVRDVAASKPNESVWTVTCESGVYRMRIVPDMAARIEKLNK